jgi:sterol desaturase/sphingolipid hydroxylase (fatty acid hydroxylase superfamily)
VSPLDLAARAVSAIASLATLAVAFVPLERVFPARAAQRIGRAALHVDLVFFAGQYLVWTSVSVALLSWTRDALGVPVVAEIERALSSVPRWLVGVVAVVLGDVSVYWFHRACHRFDFLWRFHAVHHSARELDWVAAHREHPFDGILTQLLQNLPAILLAFPLGAIGWLAAFRGLWAIFVHSNARLPLGPLRWVLGAPELHHWHHAKVRRTVHNFANLAPWLDWVFGTHHAPEGPETYELGLDEPAPEGYLGLLVHPFTARADAAEPIGAERDQKSLIFQAPRSRTSAIELPEP